MPGPRWPRGGQPLLAQRHQLGVRARAHQLGELGRRSRRRPARCPRAPRCCPSSTSPGRGRRGPSRAGRTRRSRPPAPRCRRAGHPVVRPPDRQLPAHVGLGLERSAPGRAGPARAARSPRRRRSRAGSGRRRRRRRPGSCGRPPRRSPPASWCRGTATSPGVSRAAVFERALLVLLVGEVRAEGAAAVVRAFGEDPRAAGAEDARPPRRQPGEVAAEDLLGVVGVDELDPGAREVKVDLRHRVSVRAAGGG